MKLCVEGIGELLSLWHDTVWSKVIAGIIVGTIVAGVAYVLRGPSLADHLDRDNNASRHHFVPRCKSATIYADV